MEQYRADGFEKVLGQRLNAHNQFIQTFITLGVLGAALLAAMFLVPAVLGFRKEAWIYLTFLTVTGISMLFESMLETQAGVVFYAFFNTFLFAMSHADPSGDAFKITGGEG
jgi:O-antigen ligase